MNSIASQIESTISTWRLLDVEDLKWIFKDQLGNKDRYLRLLLHRLAKASKVFRIKNGNLNLVFDKKWHSRWQYLNRLQETSSDLPLKRAGFIHHLELVRTGVLLQSLNPSLNIRPVFNLDPSMRRNNSAGIEQLYSPDLVGVDERNGESLLYIEYEATAKTPARYWDRWTCYEGDPSISFCLYVVDSPELEVRISNHMREYFRRTYSTTSYQMGVIQKSKLHRCGEVLVLSPGNESKRLVEQLFSVSEKRLSHGS